MPNANTVILIGHLTRKPELSYLPSQTPVCQFSIAVNEYWRGKDGEKKKEAVSFVDCQAFKGTAEFLADRADKGQPLYIEGSLKQNRWKAEDGTNRSKVRITVKTAQLLHSKPKTDEGGNYTPESEKKPQSEDAKAPPPTDDILF